MAHITTRDQFGFVGSHVIRKTSGSSSLPASNNDSKRKMPQNMEEHGWLTRYDDKLDIYTLFIPGKGSTMHSRGEVVKFLSNPDFQLITDDADEFPPPIEDHTSRYVGVPMLKSFQELVDAVNGKVTCYLPFADLYKVSYEDDTTEEVNEDAIINNMIYRLTTQAPDNTATYDGQRKRRKVTAPMGIRPTVENIAEQQRDTLSSSQSAPPTTIPVSSLPIVVSSPVAENSSRQTTPPAANLVDEPMESPPNMLDMLSSSSSSLGSQQPAQTTEKGVSGGNVAVSEPSSEFMGVVPADELVTIKDETQLDSFSRSPASPSSGVPFYVVEHPLHLPTPPLENRGAAFEYVRQELLNLLDRKEAGDVKTAMQYSVLHNTDIKDRDSIRRFLESKGLIVINHLLKCCIADDGIQERDDDLLFMLKLLAMLPTPTESQVMESNIGKTIGTLTKLSTSSSSRITTLPPCIAHLAKWIKTKWIHNIKRAPQSPVRRSDGKSGRPSKQLGGPQQRSNTSNNSQATAQRPHQQTNDSVPIPRVQRQPPLTAIRNPDVLGNVLSRAPDPAVVRKERSNLKPDWMRHKENLSRTRFSIKTNTNAEMRHYQRDRRPFSNAGGSNQQPTNGGPSTSSGGSGPSRRSDSEHDAGGGGERGVYGRNQRLSFGTQWLVQEFFKDTPPNVVRPFGVSSVQRRKQQHPLYGHRSAGRPRSALRRQRRACACASSLLKNDMLISVMNDNLERVEGCHKRILPPKNATARPTKCLHSPKANGTPPFGNVRLQPLHNQRYHNNPPTQLATQPNQFTERLTAADGDFNKTGVLGPLPSVRPTNDASFTRLQTLSQLAEQHLQQMRHGDFVRRSEQRWRQFTERADNRSHACPDAAIAYAIVAESSAIVIQCSWRRYIAILMRKRLTNAIWDRQITIAAWICKQRPLLQHRLRLLDHRNNSSLLIFRTEMTMSVCGAYYRLPASLLACWFAFFCTKAAALFLRRSPVILRTIDWPVRQTLRLLSLLWGRLSEVAALTLQCAWKAFTARQFVRKLRLQVLRHRSAVRLQCFFRTIQAQRLASRLRKFHAALRIQFCWRSFQARKRVFQMKVTYVATQFYLYVTHQSIKTAVERTCYTAATSLQRIYRGRQARTKFRWLWSLQQQQKWRKNPRKAFLLLEQKRFDQAALCFESCFRQGIYTAEEETNSPFVDYRHQKPRHYKAMVSGSRMSFSFSASPTKFESDWVLRSPYHGEVNGNGRGILAVLAFWEGYAISHYQVYEATGELFNLRQARVGWQSYLDLVGLEQRKTALWLNARFNFVKCCVCAAYTQSKERENALGMISSLLKKSRGLDNDDKKAQLLMWSSMLLFQARQYVESCHQLEKLLELIPLRSTQFSALEVRFILGLSLLMRIEENGESELRARTERLFIGCYQEMELLPCVGFYHGRLSHDNAKKMLLGSPVGAFLLHHLSGYNGSEPDSTSSSKMYMKVKLEPHQEGIVRITSLRIDFDASTGVYRSSKLPNLSDLSLHGFLSALPSAAGVQMAHGVRKKRVLDDLLQFTNEEEQSEVASLLLSWSEWQRRFNGICSRGRLNETWSLVCLEMARAMEQSEAWVFSEFLAKEAILHSKNRFHRAMACFVAGRVTWNVHKRVESMLFLQQAHLETPISTTTHQFRCNLNAFRRVCNRSSHSHSTREPFERQLERIEKLERMCLKAWRFDSLSMKTCGDPFKEALLLQRIDDELYSHCGDTFFIRSLLKAHVRAFLLHKNHCEQLHLEKAAKCVVRLFERFFNSPQHEKMKFTIDLLLLSWHHMPFLVCFEIAEVYYRFCWSYSYHKVIIDMYESLYGRLRAIKPPTMLYTSYEELLLLRLAFIKAHHALMDSEHKRAVHGLKSCVELLDELLELRRWRQDLLTERNMKCLTPKRITYPLVLTLPLRLTDDEVSYLRGYIIELLENLQGIAVEKRASWRDFDALHQQLMESLTNASRKIKRNDRRADEVQGIRVFIGATKDITIKNVLTSDAFVLVQCDGKTIRTQTPPNWTNLTPCWDEFIEVTVDSSQQTHLMVILMNRTKRKRAITIGQENEQIGMVELSLHDILSNQNNGEGQFYTLKPPPPLLHQLKFSEGNQRRNPQLFLGFQVIWKPKTAQNRSNAHPKRAKWVNRLGNWQLDDVQANLHGDLRTFVESAWVWSRLARLFMEEKEFIIARWLFERATTTSQGLTYQNEGVYQSFDLASDVISLGTCYRATMDSSQWVSSVLPLVDKANAILSGYSNRENKDDVEFQKQWKLLTSLQEAVAASADGNIAGPLAAALAKCTPASSQWVKMTPMRSTACAPIYFFNQNTGETFQSKSEEADREQEPLEYEDTAVAALWTPFRPLQRGILLMTPAMKQRVRFYYENSQARHANDPFQWLAVFNDRTQEMQFFSQTFPETSTGPHNEQQPPSYVMLADETQLYYVLVVQDAYRKYLTQLKKRRRMLGIWKCIGWLVNELKKARMRLWLRAELARKQKLNCLYVVVETAQHLRAGDLIFSDPFVVLTLTDANDVCAMGKTSVKMNTRKPQWNEEFHLPCKYETDATKAAALRLTLKVFDYDLIPTRKYKGGDNNLNEKSDLLGMVVVPIAGLDHGKRMTADLTLEDEEKDSEEDNSSRLRGLLTITVQWIHYEQLEDKTKSADSVENVPLAGRKKPRPKPELTEDQMRCLAELQNHMEGICLLIVDMVMNIVDPLQRLQKRMKVAQAIGKTAEEAKVLEQRIESLQKTQLRPKLSQLEDALEIAAGVLNSFTYTLESAVSEYIDSLPADMAQQLTFTLNECMEKLTLSSKDVITQESEQNVSDSLLAFFQSRKLLQTWYLQLTTMLEVFFARNPSIKHLEPALTKMNELCDKLDGVKAPTAARNASEVVEPTMAPNAISNSTISTVDSYDTSNMNKPPGRNAVGKRMERLQKEKRRKQR